jgi:UDP-N-acetylglucosamine 2-epimerase (non-hydrolysing)
MKILSVVGARPNFMKIAPFCKAIQNHNSLGVAPAIEHILVHTGQHYDVRMSEAFFHSLNIPAPDINLEIGSGTHAEQLGHTMIAFEKVLIDIKPDWVVVVGDVNATLACSVIAKRHSIKVCHIEAGLRSGDLSMPEEVNRLVTDRLSDLLLTPDLMSSSNLLNEGTAEKKVKFVGNIMIDTLEDNRIKASKLKICDIIVNNFCSEFLNSKNTPANNEYAVVTIHRPSNVDDLQIFTSIIDFILDEVAAFQTVIWPIHPRAFKQLVASGLIEKIKLNGSLILLEPIGYHEMLRLNMSAKIMLTDSGGLQEECCVLGTPCLTLRWNTERPITLKEHGGASVLVGNNVETIRKEYYDIMKQDRKPQRPELWDGHTADRILTTILNYKSDKNENN